MQYAEKCAKHRERESQRRELPSTKRRRLILKQERAVTQGAQEVLEGKTYQSGILHMLTVLQSLCRFLDTLINLDGPIGQVRTDIIISLYVSMVYYKMMEDRANHVNTQVNITFHKICRYWS